MTPHEPRGPISFDRIAADYDATRGGVERAALAAADVAVHLVPGVVLEVGVGTGLVAEALAVQADHRWRVLGADISASMLERASARLPGRLLRAAAERLPLPDGAVDGVVMVHVLHLVPDLAETLAEAARVLRPGGRLVAVHGEPDHADDDLTRATVGRRTLRGGRADTPAAVSAAAPPGLRLVVQQPSSERVSRHTPAELAELYERRAWSQLWDLDDDTWRRTVVPMIDALRALPDQQRPREQRSRLTVTVFERS